MKKQIERIIIANTSTTEKEMQPYMKLAKQFGYRVFYVITEGGWNNTKSIHNVPDDTLDKMKNRFEISL